MIVSAAPRFRSGGRPGLTLMELVIVLTVLVALAAIVVPMFPNILRRAHKASDATQSSELAKAILTYQALYDTYPDNFDLLTDGTNGFPDFMPGSGSTAGVFGGFAVTGTITAAEAAALNEVGITQVHKFAASTAALNPDVDGIPQPSLNPYSGTYPLSQIPVSATGTLFAILDPNVNTNYGPLQTGSKTTFLDPIIYSNAVTTGGTTTYPRFIVLGVGPRSDMVGKSIQDAPTSVPQNKDLTPFNNYCHFGAIYMISGAEVSRTGRARFIACVAMEDDELELTTKDAVGYYQVAK